MKRPADAVADYSDLIERTLKIAKASGPDVQPGAKLARVYRKRAEALSALDRTDEAMADVNEAIDLNPSDADAYSLRQQLHLKKNQFSEAAADERRAAALLLRQLPSANP